MLAATGWGCTGLFVNIFSSLGLAPMQIASIRVFFAALIIFPSLLIGNRQALKIKAKDIYLFIGTGVLSLSMFNWTNFNAIILSSMSVATVLLYTSPAFVLIMAVIFFKEKLTRLKVLAVLLTILGSVFISGLIEGGEARVSPLAFIFGIASGFSYALYSIFGRLALEKYSPPTVIFYSFILSSLALVPLSKMGPALSIIAQPKVLLLCLAFGLFNTALPCPTFSIPMG